MSTIKKIKIALVGNPNCGKTTLFNKLTGSNQYVGNWPGVTVEKKEGQLSYGGKAIILVDLPGIYSLSPYSPEEIVTRNFLIEEKPDLIINIVDGSNLERNLYLTTQLMELEAPMIVALNMMDAVEKKGDTINSDILENNFSVKFIPISANKGIGCDKLLESAISSHISKAVPIYTEDVEEALGEISKIIKGASRLSSVKILEGDRLALKGANLNQQSAEAIRKICNKLKQKQSMDIEMVIADQRYKFICKACKEAVEKSVPFGAMTISDKIDNFVTNKYLAIPIFLGALLLIFAITFGPFGSFLSDGAEYFIKNILSPWVENGLIYLGTSPWAVSLVVRGVIVGVGSVISFLPQILLLFLLLSLLEDTGYMARAAFITDKLLRKIGLSGRAFVPMLMGFGCTVPAVMGTRILESEKDKRLTILITPFMSCSAKMPVYSMFILAFFKDYEPLIIFSIYILGIIVAILTALLFKNTILKGESAPFVMELPPYRMPTLQSLWIHVWERLRDFLTKAGTILLGASIVIWFLQSFSPSLQMVQDSSQSILAAIGTFIAPVFTLCGFGDWQSSVALLTGVVAKESVLSTISVLYPAGIDAAFTTLSAYSFMIFVLLYTPCIAALAAIRREMNSAKWTLIAVVYQPLVAWFASALFYQVSTLILRMI